LGIRTDGNTAFVRLLQCASKFGDDLHMHANRDLVSSPLAAGRQDGMSPSATFYSLLSSSLLPLPPFYPPADAVSPPSSHALSIQSNVPQWELAATNSTKSAFFLAKLRPKQGREDGFFERYGALGSAVQQRSGVKCCVYVKVGPGRRSASFGTPGVGETRRDGAAFTVFPEPDEGLKWTHADSSVHPRCHKQSVFGE
jgi:hypothetical protein